MPVCTGDTSFKSMMDYRKITSKGTAQYKYREIASDDSETGIRVYQGRYLIAISISFGNVGDFIDVKLDSGQIIPAVIGDIKANTSCKHPDGSMIEFIVNIDKIDNRIKRLGSFNEMFTGNVVEVIKL